MNFKQRILHATGLSCIVGIMMFAVWTVGLSLSTDFFAVIFFIFTIIGLCYSIFLFIDYYKKM